MVRVVVQGGAGGIVNDGETFHSPSSSSSACLAGTFSSRYIKTAMMTIGWLGAFASIVGLDDDADDGADKLVCVASSAGKLAMSRMVKWRLVTIIPPRLTDFSGSLVGGRFAPRRNYFPEASFSFFFKSLFLLIG